MNVDANIDVLFAGLAPGRIGVYQFDIRVPVNWASSVFLPFCNTINGYAYFPEVAVKQ